MDCICLPSQVGCKLGCVFCYTGQGGLVRNLGFKELVDLAYGTLESVKTKRRLKIDRVLFNREGEPLGNYWNVLRACRFLKLQDEFQDAELLISTAGLVPWIYRLAKDNPEIELWVSLNAPTSHLRNKIMPINRVYSLNQLIAACSHYANISGRKVRLNYILIESVNDSKCHAQKLAALVRRKPFRLQIAKMNPCVGYRSPSEEKIHAFLSVLENANIEWEYFVSKGAAIGAGCGQAHARKMCATEVI
jgi:23S rRNA (adenine2503-C2)-methyltransferase